MMQKSRLGAIVVALTLVGCGSAGSSNPVPSVGGPSQKLPQSNGQSFTLASCVPVTNDLSVPYPVVGTACGGTAPASGGRWWIINGNAAIQCFIVVDPTQTVTGFQCNGNPYA